MTNKVTRFPNGVTDISPFATLRDMPILDASKFQQIFDDFTLNTGERPTALAPWSTNLDATFRASNDLFGALECETGATTDDPAFVRADELHLPIVRGNRIWYKTRMKYNENDTITAHAGLANNITVLPASGFFFNRRPLQGGAIEFNIRAGSGPGLHDDIILDFVSGVDEYFTAAFYWDGDRTFEITLEDATQKSENLVVIATEDIGDIPFGTSQRVITRIETDEDVLKLMTIDYIYLLAEIDRGNS